MSETVDEESRQSRRSEPRPRELVVEPLLTNNATVLPEVYECLYAAETATAVDVTSGVGTSRQVVHANLGRLVDAGLATRDDDSTYRLVRPALAPAVVQSLTELGSPLRRDLCGYAVDERTIAVRDVRDRFDLSAANARKILNALADDGFLSKRSGDAEGGLLTYEVTTAGARALEALDDPRVYLGRDGDSVAHHASGIEGTAFHTAYEVEDVYVIAQSGETTVDELLAATEKSATATRRRLDRLVDRGLLEESRREGRNTYRPAPRTGRTVEAVRTLEDERRRRAWKLAPPDRLRDRLPDPFFPEDLYRVLSTFFHETPPSLVNEYVRAWKDAGLVAGNRQRGLRFTDDR